jgi:hypothetical protein
MTIDHHAATQSAFAAALLDPVLPIPAGVTCHRGEADAARFAVYRNNVFAGLVRALEKVFPVTRRLVGEEFFFAMARAYAAVERPGTPLLFEYGRSFPDFVAGFQPAQVLAYLPDVARLELAWLSAYHARDSGPLAVAALGAVPAQRLGNLRVHAHPAARLLVSAHPVGTIWAAHQGESVARVEIARAEAVLVTRPVLDVGVHILPAADAPFAAALFAGATLAEAASAAADDGRFDFGAALVGLTALGAFEAILED